MPEPVPPLVDGGWLARHRAGRDVLPVHVAGSPEAEQPEQEQPDAEQPDGHPPGAVVLDWTRDLHEPVRRGFLGPRRFEALTRAHGLTPRTHVVLTGTDPGYVASAYWLFRYHRHDPVSLLDGPPPAAAVPAPPPAGPPAGSPDGAGHRAAAPDTRLRVFRDELLARFVGGPPGTVLLDGRSAGEFAGRVEHPLDLPWEWHRVCGHVPGARNLPARELLTRDGRFRTAPELTAAFARRGVRPGDATEVAVYCRVGEVSSLLWFALHVLLGHPRVRVYDGGWAEYGSLVEVPVERPGRSAAAS